jgi:Domain of unknown function (DUF4333)
MTLNPVGAPACVRCNTPLPASSAVDPPAMPITADPSAMPITADPSAMPRADDPACPASVPRYGSASRTPPVSPGFASGATFRPAGLPPTGPPPGARPPARPQPGAARSAAQGRPGPSTSAGPEPGGPAAPDAPGPRPSPADRLGPGLAAPPRAAPGSSRAAAASVQPPGYGLADPPPASPVASSPAEPELRRARRRIAIAGVATSALVLAGGGAALWLTRPHYVDTAAVGRTVGAELSTRLGQRVLVRCDGSPRRQAGETFRCTATDATGTRRTVTVTLLDDAGRYRWQLGRDR